VSQESDLGVSFAGALGSSASCAGGLTGASAGDRWAAGELVDLAGQLARAERDDRRLTVKSIAPGYVDRARQHEPGGCALLAVVIDHLARREMPLWSAGGRAVSTLAPSSTGNI
jgi:hypothetical protein